MIKNSIAWFSVGFSITLGVAAADYVVEYIKKNYRKDPDEEPAQNVVIGL